MAEEQSNKVVRMAQLFALLDPCPLCLDITYSDADGQERILYDPCRLHTPEIL